VNVTLRESDVKECEMLFKRMLSGEGRWKPNRMCVL